jgi:hypothetical protein
MRKNRLYPSQRRMSPATLNIKISIKESIHSYPANPIIAERFLLYLALQPGTLK